MIPEIKKTTENIYQRTNEIIREVNEETQKPVSKSIQAAARKIKHRRNIIYKAFCAQNAPSSNHISCHLHAAGETPAVEVYCDISGGSSLSECSRLLTSGDLLFVYWDGECWRALEGFQAMEICSD